MLYQDGSGNDTVKTRLDNEATARKKADEILQNNINSEVTDRKNADTNLGGRIDAEAEARQKGDADMMNALRDESEDLNNRIDEEISDRKDADTALGQRIDAEIEELEEKLRGTMPNPISIYETELNHTWRPGFYRSHIVELKPDFGDVNTDWTVAVSNSSYTDDIGDTYFKITQAAIGDDGTVKAYRTVCAKCDNESQVLNTETFGEWKFVTLYIADIAGLQEELTDITTKVDRRGTWVNPYIVSDPETDLSTLTTPGVYHFTFEKEVYAEKKEGYGNFGCYTNGYMEVVSLWNDYSSKAAVGQTLYVCDEGQFYSCTRVVESGVGVKWRISAWVADITNPDLESRVAHLEKVIKSLTGGGENEVITTATEDEADNVLNKYFS